jgi:tRNA(fMet)-specific endonuclease VapC
LARLIDTSTFVALERRGGLPTGLSPAVGDDAFALSSITASELLVGVHRADSGHRRARREAFVQRILETIPIIPVDLAVARIHAALLADLTTSGITLGAHDLLIGATAIAHDAGVVTENLRDFDRIPGLQVFRPEW